MKKLILGCLLALFASGCNDNEPEQKPVELKISFAGENPVEFTVGEQKRLAFTVTGDDLEGLTFAAEPDEALSGWTVVVSAGREGDAYAGALDVTASATPSETAVTLTVTDRNGKPWSATTPTLTAVQAPVTAIDLSRDGTANCYIVSEAGDYMFDAAVRGNGSGDDAAIALADGMKADWLWVTKGLEQEISAVSLDAGKGRIFFTAAGAAKGNAVIALADAAGEIVWSWHLWFTPEPRMVTYANGRVLLDRSLGAVGTTPGSAEAYGLYYQWGRKDPFCGGTAPKPRRLLLRRRRKIRSSIRPSPIRMRGSRRAGRPFRHWNTPRRIRFRSFRTKVRPEFTTGWPSPAPICGIPRKPATIRAPWGIRCRTAIRGTILRTIRTAMWTEPRNGMGRSTA